MPLLIQDMGPSADIGAIRQLLNDWKVAFEAKDVDRVMAYYPPNDEIVTYDLMPPLEFAGQDSYRQSWIAFFGAIEGQPKLEHKDVQVKCSSDVGFAYGMTRIAGRMGGHDVDMWIRDTKCLRKIDGQWLFVHDHLSVPMDFASGKACTELKP